MVDASITGSHEVSGVNPIYNFLEISNVNNRQNQTVLAIPLVNQSPSSNFLFRFSGKQEEITFEFFIYQSDTDRSGGTAPAGTFASGVKTIAEQIDWMKNYVYNEDFDTYWTFTQSTYYDTPLTGVITNLEITQEGASPNLARGRFTFKIGNVGSL